MMNIPELGSRHGADVDALVMYVHWLMIVLFVGWMAYFIYVLFRFNEKSNPKADSVVVTSHMTTYLEVAIAVIEAVILIGFAVPMWAKQVGSPPADDKSTVIRVVAEQFTWNARYPGEDGKFGSQNMLLATSDNVLGYDPEDPFGADDVTPPMRDIRVPLQTIDEDGDGKPDRHSDGQIKYLPVVIHLSSKDVIHSFKVNTLRVCQDAMPGMNIPLHFEPTKTGRYLLTCAQLCGNGHASMSGYVTVATPEEYAEWQGAIVAAAVRSGGGGDSFE